MTGPDGKDPNAPTTDGDPIVATFVFADLAGYTALTEAHGDTHAADVAEAFCARVRTLLAEHAAEEVKTIGDALLIRVPEAAGAIELARRIVGGSGVEDRSLAVRVGMHTGTAVRRGEDWFGAAVNVAARVADAARSGEVLVSKATREAAAGAVADSRLRSRGRRHLKNVREPVELFALVADDEQERRALPVDPVCRMAIDPSLAADRQVYRGVEYHFCSPSCAQEFRAAPYRYVGSRSSRAALLVSDQARERAARSLARAYSRGRIEAGELEERTEIVWSARTRGDLTAATHDLPRRRAISPWLAPIWPLVWLVRRTRRGFRRLARRREQRRLGRGE